jgi:hypothetical protein
VTFVSGIVSSYFLHSMAPRTAMSSTPSSSERKTTSRWRIEVELYRWTIAWGAPSIDW